MERKLRNTTKILKHLTVIFAILAYGFVEGQSISNLSWNPTLPNTITFDLTNGTSNNQQFLPSADIDMSYRFQLSTSNPFSNPTNLNNITIITPPSGQGASLNYERNFFVPNTFAPGIYYLRVEAIKSGQGSYTVYSNIVQVELKYAVSIDDLSTTGYVRCQTPAVSYRLATVRNTGNLPQAYNLSLNPNIAPTEQNLAFDILSIEGNPINSTPELSPGGAFTFLVRIAAIPGTQGGKYNYTELIATAQSDSNVFDDEEIRTLTYCGNANNIPDLPGAPDLHLIKEGPTDWIIGEKMTYKLILANTTPINAIFPTITDSIPVNLDFDILDVYKSPGDPRTISKTFDNTTRVLKITYATNNQNTFRSDDNNGPIVIYIDVIPNCYVTLRVTNTAFASNGAGDSDNANNVSSVITDMQFDTSNQVDWTGRFNEDWFECANWDKGIVPDYSIDVNIPPNTTPNQQPIIFDTEVAEARSLTIQGGATLSMEANANLEINGNWTNNGDFVHGNGTVAFVGSNNQQIEDNSVNTFNTPTFSNLKINTTNNAKVIIPNDQGLFVNNQLNLESGVLRLEGYSQLIQPVGATVDANSGKLWRDQQGQANMYNYNYWSSPVGNDSGVYTIASAMKDGSDVTNPPNIQWTGDLNVPQTNPITVSSRWLYKFESDAPEYKNWQKIMPGSTLFAGQGYTMKGSALNPNPGVTQNYTFVGVPFTGEITHTISNGQISLLGNPYASALDAYQFIDDNENVIEGYLEFWDHFETTNSHMLALYKGGYAKYNKIGLSLAAVNTDGFPGVKIPARYVPVGQGFFVTAADGITGNPPIEFKNSQRAFVRENDTDGMQLFGVHDGQNASTTNFEKPTRIRLNMVSAENYRHQIAIGFMQDKATESIDYGYDAKLRETDPNQFYFMHPEAKLLIQGVGYFDEDKKYPLGVIAELQGRYTFSIDQIENLGEHTPVYLYDNEKQIYHNLRKGDYLVYLSKGEHNTRFSLRFKNHNLDHNLNAQEMLSNIVVYRQNDHVVISNPTEQLTILNARMYNVLGQEVTAWNISNGRENYIELPLRPLASGIYVVQVQTDNGTVSKKINIR